MNSTFCWYCGKLFDYDGEKYRDVNCEHCGVQNSIYNPALIKPIPEEEEMIDYGDEKYQGKFVYLPLMGETAVFDIAEINEIKSDNPKFNFSENVPVMINGEPAIDDEGEALTKKKDLGYHIEAKLKNGKILSVTSMSAFIQVFKKHNIQDGENVKIFHKDKGEWIVEKLV
jgi:hypothetical protein